MGFTYHPLQADTVVCFCSTATLTAHLQENVEDCLNLSYIFKFHKSSRYFLSTRETLKVTA